MERKEQQAFLFASPLQWILLPSLKSTLIVPCLKIYMCPLSRKTTLSLATLPYTHMMRWPLPPTPTRAPKVSGPQTDIKNCIVVHKLQTVWAIDHPLCCIVPMRKWILAITSFVYGSF